VTDSEQAPPLLKRSNKNQSDQAKQKRMREAEEHDNRLEAERLRAEKEENE
jgi:hypothetical protein